MKFRRRQHSYYWKQHHATKVIPYGDYCYGGGEVCPFWSCRETEGGLDSDNVGYCSFRKISDKRGAMALFDQVKYCGINNNRKHTKLSGFFRVETMDINSINDDGFRWYLIDDPYEDLGREWIVDPDEVLEVIADNEHYHPSSDLSAYLSGVLIVQIPPEKTIWFILKYGNIYEEIGVVLI